MTADNQVQYDPKYRSASFYTIAHDAMRVCYNENIEIMDGKNESGRASRLLTTLKGIVLPQCVALERRDPGNVDVKKFKERWKELDDKFGNSDYIKEGRYTNIYEETERYNAVMEILALLGVAELGSRESPWQDEFLEFMRRGLEA